jgi:hypothetical protein
MQLKYGPTVIRKYSIPPCLCLRLHTMINTGLLVQTIAQIQNYNTMPLPKTQAVGFIGSFLFRQPIYFAVEKISQENFVFRGSNMSQRKRKTVFSALSVLTLAALVSGCASSNKPAVQTTHKINMNALFSDQGQLFFSPQEPSATDPVQVTLRSAVDNLSSANLVVQGSVTKKRHPSP